MNDNIDFSYTKDWNNRIFDTEDDAEKSKIVLNTHYHSITQCIYLSKKEIEAIANGRVVLEIVSNISDEPIIIASAKTQDWIVDDAS